jgi:enoyl-CoA hydratase/carnithine racemase
MAGQVRLPAQDVLARAYDDATSAEHREGVSAFLEKRSPRF